MIVTSLFALGSFFVLGSSFASVGFVYFEPVRMLGALLTFFALEQGMTGTNLVTFFFWLIKLFV
jgi:hypothetical protein